MWVLTYKGSKKIHLLGRGLFDPSPHDMTRLDYHEVPDQDVSRFYQGDPPEIVGSLDDLKQYTAEEQAQLIDRDTGKAIDEAMHPFAGVEEQIGTLRAQIGEILNTIGLAPTADFDHLNNIATEKIQEGQKKKEAL